MATPNYNEQYRYQGRKFVAHQQGGNWGAVASAMGQNKAGEQLQALGNEGQDLGRVMAQEYNARQEANVNEALNNYQSAFTTWQSEQKQKKGKDALSTQKEFEEFKRKTLAEVGKNFNDVERTRFDHQKEKIVATQGAWANDYEYNEEQSYLDANTKASFDNCAQQIAQFPHSYGSNMERVDALIGDYAQRKGLSDEATASYGRSVKTDIFSSIISTKINENNLGGASAALEKAKGVMDEERYTKFNELIKNKREALYKKAQAEQAEREARVLEANINEQASSILSVVASAPTVAEREQMAVKYYAEIKDPKVRRAVSSLVSEEFKYQETLEKSKVYDAVQAFSKEASDMSPREQANWKFEKGYQGAELNAINEIIDDQNTKENEENIRQQQEGFVFVDSLFQNASNAKEENVKAYIADSKMTTKQGQELLDYYNNGGSIGGITQTNINNAYKYATGKTDVKNMPSELSNFIRQNAPIGREPTQFEINQLAGLYYMKGDSESKWWGTSEPYAEAERNGREKEWLPTITDDEKVIIQAQLENANIYPTDKNMQIYKRRAMLDLKGDSYDYQGVSEGQRVIDKGESPFIQENVPKQKTIQSELDKDFEKHTPFSFGNSHLTEAGKKYYIVERQLQVLKGKSSSDEQKQEAIAVLEKYDAVNAPYLQDEMIEEIKDALARYGNE